MFIFGGTYVRQSWYPTLRNFRETKCYFRELEKNFREGFQHNMHGFRN